VGSIVIKADKEAVVTEKAELKRKPVESSEKTEKELKIILKSDVQGTLEAIVGNLPDEAQVIFKGVGDVNKSDIFLASAGGAEIISFNVKTPSIIKKLAKTEKIKIRFYNVIYELLQEIKKELSEKKIVEEVLGKAEIIAEFEIDKERIAGCKVKEGKIAKIDKFYLTRGEKEIGRMKIKSMKYKKEDIVEVKEGKEFGALFTPTLDFKVGDMLISYRIKNGPKT
jgi:translation initiation factor IF-2